RESGIVQGDRMLMFAARSPPCHRVRVQLFLRGLWNRPDRVQPLRAAVSAPIAPAAVSDRETPAESGRRGSPLTGYLFEQVQRCICPCTFTFPFAMLTMVPGPESDAMLAAQTVPFGPVATESAPGSAAYGDTSPPLSSETPAPASSAM